MFWFYEFEIHEGILCYISEGVRWFSSHQWWNMNDRSIIIKKKKKKKELHERSWSFKYMMMQLVEGWMSSFHHVSLVAKNAQTSWFSSILKLIWPVLLLEFLKFMYRDCLKFKKFETYEFYHFWILCSIPAWKFHTSWILDNSHFIVTRISC